MAIGQQRLIFEKNMNASQDYFYLASAILILVGGLSSCGAPTQKTQNSDNSPPPAAVSNTVTPTAQPSEKIPKSTAPILNTAKNTVSVTIYEVDSQCNQLIPKKIVVPASNSLHAAVGKVLEPYDTKDFDIAGYEVRVAAKTGVATVEMRLSPNSKRQFVSLSSCEQFGLFGSLRKTLTSNPAWKIKEVRFSERGREIEF